MFWMILCNLCIIYYFILKYLVGGQEMIILWPVLGVLFLLVYFYKRYRKKRTDSKWPLWLRTFCTTSVMLALILTGVVESRIIAQIFYSPKPNLDYIVVLSQNELPGESDEEWMHRLDCAAAYLKENPGTRVIVSGGWDSEKGSSQAHMMYQYLIQKGIENRRIFWEIYSDNTVENLRNCMTMVGGPRVKVGIIASDYFAYRAERIARSIGFTGGTAIPCNTDLAALPHRLAAEFLYVLHDKFLGIETIKP